jgi:hypothetical protein
MTVEELQPLIKGKRSKPVPSVTSTGHDPLPETDVLKALKKCCPNAVFFTTIPRLEPEETETASDGGETATILQPLRMLYDNNNELLGDSELREEVTRTWRSYRCSHEQALQLEGATKGQSVSPLWFEHRKGRITGTKAHDVLIWKGKGDPSRLVRQITGFQCYNLSKHKAVQWGNQHEDIARGAFLEQERTRHRNVQVFASGLLVDHANPFLAVSSDGIVACDCCPRRVLEIKCPFKHRNNSLTVAAQEDNSFCLDKHIQLKKSHRYFTQVQLQMFVHNLKKCQFFVYTCVDSVCIDIEFDFEFCKKLVDRCRMFFFQHVLPELLTRRLERGVLPDNLQNELDENPNNDLVCLCREPQYGKMVECHNPNCTTQYFHYECVNLRRCPKGKWYCPECADTDE